jgi:chemotaxis protein methyltransferase CheR
MTVHALTDGEFSLFQRLMSELAGVRLPSNKQGLVSSRLERRLRERGLHRFGDYFRLITSGEDPAELQRALDLLTTHETFLFREPGHFDFLAGQVLPRAGTAVPFRAWSAAASSGEEAYSIAMVLMDRLGAARPWEVFGSDISTEVLEAAREGVYRAERLDQLPPAYLRGYCLRGVGRREGTIRIAAPLRERVRFAQINLNGCLPELGSFDVIFLRNVLIYFEPDARREVVERLAQRLKPGGWLFVGHSESLNGVCGRLRQERPTIYRRVA